MSSFRGSSSLRVASASVALEDLLAESSSDEEEQMSYSGVGGAQPQQQRTGGINIPTARKDNHAEAAQRNSELQAILRDEETDEEDEAMPPILSSSLNRPNANTIQTNNNLSRPRHMASGALPPAPPASNPINSITPVVGSFGSVKRSPPTSSPLTTGLAAKVTMSQSLQEILHDSDTDEDEDTQPMPTMPVRAASIKQAGSSSASSTPVLVPTNNRQPSPATSASTSLASSLGTSLPTMGALQKQPSSSSLLPAAATPASAATPSVSVPPTAASVTTNSYAHSLLQSSDSDDDDDAELNQLRSSVAASSSAAAAAAAILNQASSSDEEDLPPTRSRGATRMGAAAAATSNIDPAVPKELGSAPVGQGQILSEQELALITNPLTRAEMLEQNLATLGNYQVVNPLAQVASNAAASAKASSATGLGTHLVRMLPLERISAELERSRPAIGLATTCCLHSKLFAVGTSKGIVVIFDHFESKLMMLGKAEEVRVRGAITCIDMNLAGDHLLVGYSKGTIAVWDIHNKSAIKVITDVTTSPICTLRFTKQEVSTSKTWTFMAGDTLGYLNLFVLSKQLFSYGLDKQVLLVGKAGPVLASSVLSANNIFTHFADHFGLVAIATEQVTSIIALEPAVQIVYRLPREVGERVGVLPVLAWRSLQPRDTLLNDPAALGDLPNVSGIEVEVCRHPVLAVGRGRTLTLVQAAPLSEKSEIAINKVPLKFNILHTQTFAKEIKSVSWLGSGMVLLLIFAPNDEMLLLDPFVLPLQPLASLDGRSVGIVHSEFFAHPVSGAPELSFTPSIASTDSSLLLLGSDKLFELKILPWSERLDSFIHHTDDPHWLDCLSLALEMFHGDARVAIGLPRERQQLQVRLGEKMVELITSFIQVMLHAKEGSAPASSSGASSDLDLLTGARSAQIKSDRQYLKILGGTCIAYCISISRLDVLFGDIASKFQYHFPFHFTGVGTPVSLGTEIFLELIEPYVLQDQLTTIPTHILQDMFILYHYKKKLPQLEQMLLHLNPIQLDLNFLLPLIQTYRLFSACIYMHNRGHSAFHTPLEAILGTLTLPSNLGVLGSLSAPIGTQQPMGPMTDMEKSNISYKLLLYIDYCFRGRTFPRKNVELPAMYRGGVRAQVLSVLFRKSATSVDGSTQLPDYPYLSYFLNVSTGQFFEILAQVFEGDEAWVEYVDAPKAVTGEAASEDAPTLNQLDVASRQSSAADATAAASPAPPLGSHSRQSSSASLLFSLGSPSAAPTPSPAAAPKKRPPPTMILKATGVPNRQGMLDALLFLMLDQLQTSPPAQSTSHAAMLLPFTYQSRSDHLGELFKFAAKYLSRGVVQTSTSFVNRLFTHLCTSPDRITGESGAVGGVAPASTSAVVFDMARDHAERQSTLLSLLARVPTSELEADSLLLRVRQAGFWMVQAYLTLITGKKEFARTLDALLKAVEAKDDAQLPASLMLAVKAGTADARALESMVGKAPVQALFDFIHQAINDPSVPLPALATMRTAILQRLPALVNAASDRTARLILEDFNQEHERVVSALNAFPELQFRYLQSIMTGRGDSAIDGKDDSSSAPVDIHSSSLTSGRLGGGLSSELTMTELIQRSGLQFTPKVHELYIKLLCIYAPSSVLAHLSSHQDYNIESALKLCQEYHVDDASAFLLERTGDVHGALELTLQAVDQRVVDLRKWLDAHWMEFPAPPAAPATGDLTNGSNLRRQSSADQTVLSGSASSSGAAAAADASAPPTLVMSADYKSLTKQVLNTINTATLLCQRSMDAEKLWFALLDRFVNILRTIKAQEAINEDKNGSRRTTVTSAPPPDASKQSKASAIITALPMAPPVSSYLQSALYSFVRLVLSSMMQHLELSSLLTKITTDHQSDSLREFRETIQGLLDTYSYEESILATANNLLSSDKFHSIVVLHRKKAHAFIPKIDACGCCARYVDDIQTTGKFILFDCGHIFHDACLGKHSSSCMLCSRDGGSSASKKRASSRGVDKKAITPIVSPTGATAAATKATGGVDDSKSTRALGQQQSSDEVVHRLMIAERKMKNGSIPSVSSFNTKLKRFGRGGLDDNTPDNDDDFDAKFAHSNPFASSSSSSSSFRNDDDGFDFAMPSVRSGQSMSAMRTPGQMMKPGVSKRMDAIDLA